jgi:hypothetical protein
MTRRCPGEAKKAGSGENRHCNAPTMNAEKVLNAPANPAIILIIIDSSEAGLPDGTETTQRQQI